jgi:maltose alpha-D-glucosyltransferase/alpha-amylase
MTTDAPWYKDAVFYELSVRAFADADGDGRGDLRGLLRKLDYLQDLGVTALWLQPLQPSPLRDGGYDVSDFTAVHPDYGTMADLKALLAETRRRGLRVVTDLVLNHTSDRHPWFERARRARSGSSDRRFYVWSATRDRYARARVLFADREPSNWTWDPLAGAYYWHRFYAHEPDLNYEHAEVRRRMKRAVRFWLEAGLDGLRLGAAPFLFEGEETECEDLPATHHLLRELRHEVDREFSGRALLTEADLWPEEAARYFGDAGAGECHLTFHTPLATRLFSALQVEDSRPLLDLLAGTPDLPPAAQWVLFLRNHDELSLEMVTDEERDILQRAYAAQPEARLRQGIRRRLAPMLDNDRRRIELLYGLLLSLPGSPAIYYGDELGMGDNVYLVDREPLRTPMQWTSGVNAGFSEANPQRPYLPPVSDPEFSYVAVNVAAQEANPRSLLAWMRRTIAQRRRHAAFGRGSLGNVPSSNRKVLAFVREHEDDRLLVVANLSRRAEHVELDLDAWRGQAPVELAGGNAFPAVGDRPYALTLGPHGFYWFALLSPRPGPVEVRPRATADAVQSPVRARGAWDALLAGAGAEALQPALARFLAGRRWFAGKARTVRAVEVIDAAPVPAAGHAAWLALAGVVYAEGEADTYALPLVVATGEAAERARRTRPRSLVAEVEAGAGAGVLLGGEDDPAFAHALLEAVAGGRGFKGRRGQIVAAATAAFRSRAAAARGATPSPLSAEQSNTSIRYGDAFILKLFRRLEPGVNTDLEVGIFLTERAGFPYTPPVCGSLVYQPARGRETALGILQGFVANQGDAWKHTLGMVDRFLARALPAPPGGPSSAGGTDGALHESLGGASLLGRRTAELHRALASDAGDPAFAPEPYARRDQRALYQSQRDMTEDTFDMLQRRLPELSEETRGLGQRVLGLRGTVQDRYRRLLDRRLTALRTRTHGDYHLGQVLWTGEDFVIIDFEGEPARPAAVRRAKRSPLRDVAGMLRSYHYAAYQGLATRVARGGAASSGEHGTRIWHAAVAGAFLRAYLDTAAGAPFLAADEGETEDLLVVHVLEKAVYELSYELNNRPEWVALPLRGIVELMEARA